MSKDDIFVLILLGGRSTRFGSPKGLEEVHGVPQWQYLQEMCETHGLKVFFSLSKHTRAYFKAVDEDQVIYDFPGIQGPLAGLYAGMSKMRHLSCLLLAVDLFFLDDATLTMLLNARSSKVCVTAFFYEQIQPLCAIYTPDAYEFFLSGIAKGQFGIAHTISQMPHTLIHAEHTIPHPLAHINTKQELLDVQRRGIHDQRY